MIGKLMNYNQSHPILVLVQALDQLAHHTVASPDLKENKSSLLTSRALIKVSNIITVLIFLTLLKPSIVISSSL